jgi:FkbM family methyltransferase
MLSNLLADAEGPNRLVLGRHGYCLYNRHDIAIGVSIEAYGEYFESEVAVFAQILRPGDGACDVGANIGTHMLAMARLVGPEGTVVALEPQRRMHQLLGANIALNNLRHATALHAAAGARPGRVRIPVVDSGARANFGGVSASIDGPGESVPLVTLDEVADLPRLRLIKIDVEGMEAAVVRGAARLLRKHRPYLYVENDRHEKSRALIELVRGHGYRVFWHLPMFFNPANFAGNSQQIHVLGFFDLGDHYATNGFAINLLCIPGDEQPPAGFDEAVDLDYHPTRKTANGPTLPNGQAVPQLLLPLPGR